MKSEEKLKLRVFFQLVLSLPECAWLFNVLLQFMFTLGYGSICCKTNSTAESCFFKSVPREEERALF